MLTLQMEKAIHYYIMWQTDNETNVFIHKTTTVPLKWTNRSLN